MVNRVVHFPMIANKDPSKLLFVPVMRPVSISTNVVNSRPSLRSIRENISKYLKLRLNCFGVHHVQLCISKHVCRTCNCGRKHHTLLHESFGDNNQSVEPPYAVKSVQLHGTGQGALVLVELSNGVKTIDTYAYLDKGICRSLLLTSAASVLEIDIVAKMPISGCHTTREKNFSQIFVKIKPYRSQNS